MHMTNIMHILDIIMELTAYFFMPMVSFLRIKAQALRLFLRCAYGSTIGSDCQQKTFIFFHI